MKKLEIEKTKPTFIISTFKTDIIKVGLVFSISNFFITKTSLANKWRRKKNTFLQQFSFIEVHTEIINCNIIDVFLFLVVLLILGIHVSEGGKLVKKLSKELKKVNMSSYIIIFQTCLTKSF